MFGTVTCFIRRGKTVAIDGTDVWDSDMIYKEREDSSNLRHGCLGQLHVL